MCPCEADCMAAGAGDAEKRACDTQSEGTSPAPETTADSASDAAAAPAEKARKKSRRQKRVERLAAEAAALPVQASQAATAAAAPGDDTRVDIPEPEPPPHTISGPWQWPLPLRVLLIVAFYMLSVVLSIWAAVLNVLVVTPLLLGRAPHRLLSAARNIAQRPLLALSFCVMAPIIFQGESHGVDLSQMPALSRPCSVRDVVYALRPEWVSSERVRIGVAYRRLIVHHAFNENSTSMGALFMLISLINISHLVAADAIEFRTSDGRLVGLALVAFRGAYVAGTVFAQRCEFARCGMWGSSTAMTLERICTQLPAVTVFDAGPSYDGQKRLLGLHPLNYWRTLRVGFTG